MLPKDKLFSSTVIYRESLTQDNLDENEFILFNKIRELKFNILNNSFSNFESDIVRPEILKSWIRSRDYGLDSHNNYYGMVLDKHIFDKVLSEKEYIIKAAKPFINNLQKIVFNTNFVLYLTDENGVIFFVLPGNDMMAERAKQIKLEAGVVCTEETTGTCAHALCLKLKEPIQITGPEHYCENMSERICSSAPIFDWRKNVLGTINLKTLYSDGRSFYNLGLVISMAMAIDNQINTDKFLSTALEAAEENSIILNSNGVITHVNSEVKKILGYSNNRLIGLHYQEVLGTQPLIKSVLENGEPVQDADIIIPRLNRRINLTSVQPVGYCYHKRNGCVLILQNLTEMNKIITEGSESDTTFTFNNIVGDSSLMRKSTEMARKFSSNDVNILLLGESGSGKEVFAQAIHDNSRPNKPLIAINCAAIPISLIESELFGYESGAFTGAERKGRPGKIELANEGTLFLDEIGDMPLELQAVFLRVLEDKKVMRLGGSRYISVDFRLIAATNKNLKELVKLHKFREDLYYRLSVFKIMIPPLRERGTDIISLANYFVQKASSRLQLPVPMLSDTVKLQFMNYAWPGNVRELENAIIFAVNMAKNGVIVPGDLPDDIKEAHGSADSDITEGITGNRDFENKLSMKEMEKMAISQALLESGNLVRVAAEKLAISKSTLYRKIREYKLLDI